MSPSLFHFHSPDHAWCLGWARGARALPAGPCPPASHTWRPCKQNKDLHFYMFFFFFSLSVPCIHLLTHTNTFISHCKKIWFTEAREIGSEFRKWDHPQARSDPNTGRSCWPLKSWQLRSGLPEQHRSREELRKQQRSCSSRTEGEIIATKIRSRSLRNILMLFTSKHPGVQNRWLTNPFSLS